MRTAIAVVSLLTVGSFAWLQSRAASEGSAPVELGVVQWQRDYAAAEAQARAAGKPIFLLFQEVPGCQTCVSFGESVLAHPLLVEAVEEEFVPVAILNNKGGLDRATLERFGEPARNNPVVRFVDADGRDLIPRRDRVWSRRQIAARMTAALVAAQRDVPPYLRLLVDDPSGLALSRTTLTTHCFWTGEACFGRMPGVLATRAGWMHGREVVEVRFDPRRVDYRALLEAARAGDCGQSVIAHDAEQERVAREVFGPDVRLDAGRARAAKDSDQLRHLRASPLHRLELSALQRTRINADLGTGRDPIRWLSPRQRDALRVELGGG